MTPELARMITGSDGGDQISGTTKQTAGNGFKWFAMQVVGGSAAITTCEVANSPSITLAGLTLAEGTVLNLPFDSVTPASGTLIMFKTRRQ